MSRETFKKKITSVDKILNIEESNLKLIDRFLRYKNPRCSNGTIKVYRSNFDIFFCWNLDYNDNKPFEKIRKIDYQDFFLFCCEELHFGSNRYSQLHSSLCSLSDYVENQLDEIDRYANFRNVVKKIDKLPKEPVRKKTILSQDQVDNLIKELNKENKLQEILYIVLSISSGARLSEVFRITLDLIDENLTAFDGLFLVTKEPIKTKGRGKNGKQLQKYIIKDLFLPWYKKWLPIREKIMKENGVEEHNSLFITNKGTPLSYASVYKWMKIWKDIIGVDIYPHSFRHYFVTYLSRIGIEAELIQSIVGWSSGDMVGIYNDLRADEREWKGLDKLAKALKKK